MIETGCIHDKCCRQFPLCEYIVTHELDQECKRTAHKFTVNMCGISMVESMRPRFKFKIEHYCMYMCTYYRNGVMGCLGAVVDFFINHR